MSHALVFSAPGISGWVIIDEITTYPTPTSFAKITGLSSRSFTIDQAQLPHNPRLGLINGVDLTRSVSQIVQIEREG